LQRHSTLSASILAFAVALPLIACSRPPVVRERLPDGSYSFKCESELWVCLSHVEELCRGGPYAVEGGWEQPFNAGVDETRVETHRSQAFIRCLHRGEDPRRRYARPDEPQLVDRSSGTPVPVTSAPKPTAPAPARTCVPGVTQACVGPAACAGGQACLPDGSGFTQCDCGAP
jgi:hypothetical protein